MGRKIENEGFRRRLTTRFPPSRFVCSLDGNGFSSSTTRSEQRARRAAVTVCHGSDISIQPRSTDSDSTLIYIDPSSTSLTNHRLPTHNTTQLDTTRKSINTPAPEKRQYITSPKRHQNIPISVQPCMGMKWRFSCVKNVPHIFW